MTTVTIRPMTAAAANDGPGIYQTGLDGGAASFELTAPSWAAFDAGQIRRPPSRRRR